MSSKKPKFKQHASNYNYKGKRSFGQRIKNFFTIPEEDLKEEPSKEFEKIKLFTLTRGSLFLGILVFMILINILVSLNINFLYLRQILGFLFIILIPGLLIMLCFKIRTVKFWEYLVYTVGLSIAFIMFAGLAVNWTLPALNITDKPLSLWPILICFDIFLLGLWLTAIYRNKDLKPFDITIPKLDAINRIFFIIPMAFPLLSILGAFLLNNHGPNILTMIMLGGIAIYVLLITIFRKRMNENVWHWALWMIGLSLVLMGSMRSWFLSTTDASLELYFAKTIINNSIWGLGNLNGYNAMLSVTILPAILYIFSEINLYLIIKLLFPIIFAFLPIIIYLLFNKYFNKIISFFGVLFFVFQPTITGWQLLPPRQEMAYLFLGLTLLILFSISIKPKFKKTLFIIFGVSMIVSHYSTSYVALAVFVLVYVITLIYKGKENRKIKKGRLHPSQKSRFYLTGILVLLLLIFGFFWYSQVTTTVDGAVYFTKKSIGNFNKILSEEGFFIFDPLNLFNKKNNYNPKQDLLDYSQSFSQGNLSDNQSIEEIHNNYVPSIKTTSYLSYSKDYSYLTRISENLKTFFLIFSIFLIGIGSFSIIFSKKLIFNPLFKIFLIIFLFLFVLVSIMPFSNSNYNINRLYQQQLIFLGVCSIVGFLFIFGKFSKNISLMFFAVFLILYLLFFTHVQYYFIGGREVQLRFANTGKNYDLEYISSSEISSTNWISLNKKPHIPIVSDNYAQFKNYQASGFMLNTQIKNDVLPTTIKKKDYVYSSRANTIQKITFKFYGGGLLIYNFPTELINDNKNKIYSNGGSQIFK